MEAAFSLIVVFAAQWKIKNFCAENALKVINYYLNYNSILQNIFLLFSMC